MTTETPFLVDRDRHRIGKHNGTWKLYCPMRGVSDLILCKDFMLIIALLRRPCPHWEQL